MSTRTRLRSIAPAVLVGLLSFTLTVQWRAQDVASRAVEHRRESLAGIVSARQEHTTDLERRVAELRAELAAAAGTGTIDELRRLAGELAGAAGSAALEGPGILVTLTDAPSIERVSNSSDAQIQDVDVQAVVNALWRAGAEAIAINGQRIVATSAIRNAGRSVLVNYRVLASPYKVSALGPPAMKDRFATSEIAHRFKGWEEIYGLGFAIEAAKRLAIPMFNGGLGFRYARPIQRS